MRPIILETTEEQKCLESLEMEKWPKNYNYWTAGSQEGSFGYFNWCSEQGPTKLDTDLVWANKAPNYKGPVKACMMMKFQKDKQDNITLQLSDRNCKDKYVFGCEVIKIDRLHFIPIYLKNIKRVPRLLRLFHCLALKLTVRTNHYAREKYK